MNAKRLFSGIALIASVASAQMMNHPGGTPPSVVDAMRPANIATVSGVVSTVSGTTINVANGLIAIDASAARIVGMNGTAATLASITPGSLVVATLKGEAVAANAPLPALTIAVSKAADVTLSGPVSAVDAAHNSFTLLGRTIQVNAQTSFGGPMFDSVRGLADLQPNELVMVQANASGNSLVAVSVMVMAMTLEHPDLLHGTVKSIAADAWVITTRSNDVTVGINAQTKIVGDPKVGDIVDVLTRTDSSNKVVAVVITKSILPPGMGHH